MISVFNGRIRALGHNDESVFMQTDVQFREYLHCFKGARLAVFMAISLHTNAEGWSWPSISLLSKETGYNEQTISTAIKDLCELTIEGQRVLLCYQQISDGRFGSNRYLIFPTAKDVATYERPVDNLPSTEKPATENIASNYNHPKLEPIASNDANAMAEPAHHDAHPGAAKKQTSETLLAPDTPGSRAVFAKINANRAAKGMRPQKRFANLEQKRKCIEAETRLGKDFVAAADRALGNGGVSDLKGLVNWLAVYDPNKRPAKGGYGATSANPNGVIVGIPGRLK